MRCLLRRTRGLLRAATALTLLVSPPSAALVCTEAALIPLAAHALLLATMALLLATMALTPLVGGADVLSDGAHAVRIAARLAARTTAPTTAVLSLPASPRSDGINDGGALAARLAAFGGISDGGAVELPAAPFPAA